MAMGCTVQANQHGNLYLRLYYRGEEWTEGRWGLEDDTANRKILEAKATLIAEEMTEGTFDYLKWFPEGNKAPLFRAESARVRLYTLRQYYEVWKTDKVPPFVKKSRSAKYKSHFDCHILPKHGDKLMHLYSFTDIRELRTFCVEEHSVGMKTAKNVINATLRAMFRDAKAEGIIKHTPFDDVPDEWWPETPAPPPDPYTEAERDEILNYFRDKYWSKWPHGYVFLFLQFFEGARPSEIIGRRWSEYEPRTGKLSIVTSRTQGEEGATKTAQSYRTIQLCVQSRALLKQIMPLQVKPGDYILLNTIGQPISEKTFANRHFWPALRALGIRHRDFYHTRDTYISVMLSHGAPIKMVCEHVATSIEMTEKNYGKYMGDGGGYAERVFEASAVTLPVTVSVKNVEDIEKKSVKSGARKGI